MTQPDTPTVPTTYTPEELATRWKVHYNTVMSLIKSGEIAHYKVGRQYRIPQDVVEDMEQTNQVPKEQK